jgi:hypothetical protein
LRDGLSGLCDRFRWASGEKGYASFAWFRSYQTNQRVIG